MLALDADFIVQGLSADTAGYRQATENDIVRPPAGGTHRAKFTADIAHNNGSPLTDAKEGNIKQTS